MLESRLNCGTTKWICGDRLGPEPKLRYYFAQFFELKRRNIDKLKCRGILKDG